MARWMREPHSTNEFSPYVGVEGKDQVSNRINASTTSISGDDVKSDAAANSLTLAETDASKIGSLLYPRLPTAKMDQKTIGAFAYSSSGRTSPSRMGNKGEYVEKYLWV